MKINIVYATILGTSQMVAEELEDALSDQYEIEVQDILEVQPSSRMTNFMFSSPLQRVTAICLTQHMISSMR